MSDHAPIAPSTPCSRSRCRSNSNSSPPRSHVCAIPESIQRRETPPSASPAAPTESLIQLIAHNMVDSLVKESARNLVVLLSESDDSDNNNDDSILCPSSLTLTEAISWNLDSIADRVVPSLQLQPLQSSGKAITGNRGGASTDRYLRDMLRRGLAMDHECDEDTDGGTAATISASTFLTDDDSQLKDGEVANVPPTEANRAVAGDRWDPDFCYDGNMRPCRNTAPSRASTAPESTEKPTTSDKTVPIASKDIKNGRSQGPPNESLYRFLKGRDYEISSFDWNDHFDVNHASIHSDITGLTEVKTSLSKAKHLNITNSPIKRKEVATKSKIESTPEPSLRSDRTKDRLMTDTSEKDTRKSTNVASPTASPTAWKASLSDRRLSNHSDPKVRSPRTSASDSTVSSPIHAKRTTIRFPSLSNPVAPASPTKAPPRAPPPPVVDRQTRKRVRFSQVHVRQYERMLCLNPACSWGPSIGIGWGYAPQDEVSSGVSLDEWEDAKRHIRSPSELLLSRSTREALIRAWGYSEREMAATVRELNKLRSNRRQTVNNLGAQKMEETVEAVCFKVKKLLLLKK